MALSEMQKRVVERIDENELMNLATTMGNIAAPADCEQAMADFVLDWLKSNGFHNAFQQNVAPGRSNAIGILKGSGGGKRLIFNSHMDTDEGQPDRPGLPLPPGPKCWAEGSRVYGRTVQNDRGPMAAFMLATRATFGFTRNTPPKATDYAEVADLVDCARMYALVALDIAKGANA